MIDLNEVINLLKENKKDHRGIYDKERDTLFVLDEKDINNDNENGRLWNAILGDKYSNRYVLLPGYYQVQRDLIPLKFIEYINNQAYKGMLAEALGKDNDAFMHVIESLKLTSEYDGFVLDHYEGIAKGWALGKELIVEDISDEDLKSIVDHSMDIAHLEPWKYFRDVDYFKIVLDDFDIYFSIMGNDEKTYGIEIFYGDEGLNNLLYEKLFAMTDSVSLLPAFIRNSFCVFFDYPEDISEEERKILNRVIPELKHDRYPTFMVMNKGQLPKLLSSTNEGNHYDIALEALLKFLTEYVKKPRKLPKDEEYHMTVTLYDDVVKYKKDSKLPCDPQYLEPIEVGDDQLEYFQSTLKSNGDVAYFDIKGLPDSVEDNGKAYGIFLPIFYNATTDKIISAVPVKSLHGDYLTDMAVAIMADLEGKRLPKRIYVRNPVLYGFLQVVLGKRFEFIPERDEFEEIVEIFNGMLQGFIKENNKNNTVC